MTGTKAAIEAQVETALEQVIGNRSYVKRSLEQLTRYTWVSTRDAKETHGKDLDWL